MFQGTLVALVTPFTQGGEVDYPALRKLIEWQIEEGSDGIVLCGTTGESPTLSDAEKIHIFTEGVLTAKGRVPIIAGTGSYDTHHTVFLTQEAKRVGAAGCLVVVPYYSRPTSEGCYLHYAEISKVGLPMILYHHALRTGVKIPTPMLAKISALPSLVGIKISAGEMDFVIEVIQTCGKPVFSGDDLFTLSFLVHGGAGVISVVANVIPQPWHRLTHLFASGRQGEAKEIFDRYYPLVKTMDLETNPQCVKYALSLTGRCSPKMRLPLIEPQEASQRKIAEEMEAAMSKPTFQSVCV